MPQNRFWNLLSKKLGGEATAEEIHELELLMKEYPELIYSAEQIEKIWETKPLENHVNSEIFFEQHLNRMSLEGITVPEEMMTDSLVMDETPNKPSGKTWITLCVMLILVLAVFLIWHNRTDETPLVAGENQFRGEVSTSLGNRTKLILPDSTVVWLNAGSRLNYNEQFGISNRSTTLSGEAFFDVKKSKIPFIIHANGVQIRVKGTAFNVKSYPEDKTTETSLVRGEVEITLDKRPGERIILKPNEKLIVSNNIKPAEIKSKGSTEPMVVLSSITQSSDNTIIETSWVDNKLIFQDESFEELAVKLERWYGVEIHFRSETIRKERLSGTFTGETILEALDLLQITTPFRYQMKSNHITITD